MSRSSAIGVVCSLLSATLACSSTPASTPAGGAGTSGAAASGGSLSAAGANGVIGGAGSGVIGGAGSAGAGAGPLGAAGGGAGGIAGGGGAPGGAGGSTTSSAGMGGATDAAGAGGSAGSAAGSGGAGVQAGSSGAGDQTPAGLAVLSVPLSLATDKAHFLITLASAIDLSAATITFRVNVHAGTGGVFQGYLQHGGDPDYSQFFQGFQPLTTLSGWQDIVWTVASAANPGSFDETRVGRIGIEIAGGNAGTFSSATTAVIYLDSITISGSTPASGPWTFDTAGSVSATSYPTAGILWLNSAASDTTAAGATATWLSAP